MAKHYIRYGGNVVALMYQTKNYMVLSLIHGAVRFHDTTNNKIEGDKMKKSNRTQQARNRMRNAEKKNAKQVVVRDLCLDIRFNMNEMIEKLSNAYTGDTDYREELHKDIENLASKKLPATKGVHKKYCLALRKLDDCISELSDLESVISEEEDRLNDEIFNM